ncbi:Rna binding protein musashi [Fasciola hepatica]|uniref:Rna binding protein musashi n=2 Tax=Fasciola TaxID=6191 RepID=A0A4E0R2F5_FASHE|nr:Rna binding protein musashi [Fasciola hepatica]
MHRGTRLGMRCGFAYILSPIFRKLFVGGLHQSTTNESLKSYFSKFGDIEESVVMMDNRTGRSRGFGYIKFKENTSVDSVLSQKPHVVDHKEVDPKRCNVNMKGKNRRSLKVFVGGLAFEHDEATIRSFFSNFGRVTDVNLLTSPNKQRHRGKSVVM